MLYQPWLTDKDWEQAVALPHTQRLVDAIALEPPGIVTVRGPRQCGKSTFLRQFAVRALKQGVAPGSIAILEAEECTDRHELQAAIDAFHGGSARECAEGQLCTAHRPVAG